MTHKQELEDLQNNARKSGKTCTFFFNSEGRVDSVFYENKIRSPLEFAEIERRQPHWSATLQKRFEQKKKSLKTI